MRHFITEALRLPRCSNLVWPLFCGVASEFLPNACRRERRGLWGRVVPIKSVCPPAGMLVPDLIPKRLLPPTLISSPIASSTGMLNNNTRKVSRKGSQTGKAMRTTRKAWPEKSLYCVWAIQSHRGRRSSSCSANRRTFSSRSMALPRRSFASSMRPVTLAQHASLKRINGSLGCHARAL
jgi:hypothetical protein